MIPLLPYEKYLASQLGVTEEQYQRFKALTLKHSIEHPVQGPRAGFLAPAVPFLINLAIGIGLSLISALLFPPEQQRRGRIVANQRGGQNRTQNQRVSPRFGFNATQDVALVGQLTPVVIAKRENGYGGVRVNMPMIWSQMLSLRGSQMFRGIFLAGTANMAEDAWDQRGWAFGNNTLGAYAYSDVGDIDGGRFTLYWRRGGGRITEADYLNGRRANKDVGNAENDGGQDVFSLALRSGIYEPAFCMSESPSTSTRFGLYGWCPNAMLFRPSIQLAPTMRARLGGSSGDVKIDDDPAQLAETWKGKWHWSMRCGLVELKRVGGVWEEPVTGTFNIGSRTVDPGDRVRYKISNNTDARTAIKFDTSNSDIPNNKSEVKNDMTEVGSSVAGFQVSADNFLIPGELYRIGDAWGVLENRISQSDPNETIFISDQDEEPPGNGNTMQYVFVIVKAGQCQFVSSDFLNQPEQGTTIMPPTYNPATNLAALPSGTEGRYRVCSAAAQIFRMGIASVAAVREVTVMEVGFRSRVGIVVNNMTDFRSSKTIQEINAKAGENQRGDSPSNNKLSVAIFRSGTVSTRIKRYSCFRVIYRSLAADWVTHPEVFAIASNSGEDVYNYLRFEFASPQRWEIRFEPVSSWEIRRDAINSILVLDSTGKKEKASVSGAVDISTTGYRRNPTLGKNRRIRQLDPEEDLGLGWSDYDDTSTIGNPSTQAYKSMVDGYGHFAEGFCYDSIEATVGTTPEHEITYVNYPSDLNKSPNYECLATIGINIAASLEFTNLQQFSGYCIAGYEMRQLLAADAVGSTHLFPDWLRELMTSNEVGPSPPLPDIQIDRASFQEAAQWCQDRDYFYDAVESEPLNILQWASDTAQAHLLRLTEIGGIYYLKKAIEFVNPLDIAALFTNGNIVEDSFRLETVDFQARQPFVVEVKWREESTDIENPLFARERVATVAEAGTSPTAPVEQLDLAAWCTNYQQAIDAACYLIRFRRLADHRITFQTTPDVLGARLESGSIIKVAIDVTNYDQAVQGYITAGGELVTTRPDIAPTADGSYPALLWDGTSTDAAEGDITIANGVASPAGNFFAIAAPETTTRTYEINKLSFDSEGIITVEAFHHPVDGSGMSLLGVNWTTYATDANWTITL